MMQKLGAIFLAATASLTAVSASPVTRDKATDDVHKDSNGPLVTVKNGTYEGVRSEAYNHDLFLGMPYAKPPVADLRFRVPQHLEDSWEGVRDAKEYSPQCIGYGSDTWVLGNHISEDCLTINVVRPAGVSAGDKLPVAVWVHGGAFVTGGSSDPRYNLSLIVEQSVQMGTPIVAASINYRLQSWGFLFGRETLEEGSTNVAFRDQRLALHWVQENIASFGGNPQEVTLWGESAGARSVGVQLIAYEGRDDGLFQRAVMQSASPVPADIEAMTADEWEPYFEALLSATGCTDRAAGVTGLDCLRTVPVDELSAVFNGTIKAKMPTLGQVVDGDLLTAAGDALIRQHKFVKVPILAGTNFDEGTAYGARGINTDEQFRALLKANRLNDTTAARMEELYPDDPAVGIPATLDGRPSGPLASFGAQWKRSAAYRGDTQQHGPRRFTTRMWTEAGVPAYTYHFNVRPHGIGPELGSTHFQEVAFVFNNVDGLGYNTPPVSLNPFEGKPERFLQIADVMSKMWVSFFVKGDPNYNGRACTQWPVYTLENPQNLLIDVNATKVIQVEPDTYRQEAIDFVIDVFN